MNSYTVELTQEQIQGLENMTGIDIKDSSDLEYVIRVLVEIWEG